VTGREIRYVDWLVSGLLGMNMMFSALFGVGYAIVRYRKNGVLSASRPRRSRPSSSGAQIASRMMLIMAVFAIVYHGSDFFPALRAPRVARDALPDLHAWRGLPRVSRFLVAARATSEELAAASSTCSRGR